MIKEKLNNATVGIFGGGYIGTNLAHYIRRHAPDCTVHFFRSSQLTQIGDFQFDYFFNCAGNTGNYRQEPENTLVSNLNVTLELFRVLHVRQCYIALSSTRVYGFSTEQPHHESEVLASEHLSLESLYDNTKKLLECLVLNNSCKYRSVVIRLSNVYGNYKKTELDDSSYLKLMIRHTLQKLELKVSQSLNSSKDYIYIEDAMQGLVLAAIYSTKNDIYNIASGHSFCLKEWLDYLKLPYLADAKAVAEHCNISIEKAKKELGFSPAKTLSNLQFEELVSADVQSIF